VARATLVASSAGFALVITSVVLDTVGPVVAGACSVSASGAMATWNLSAAPLRLRRLAERSGAAHRVTLTTPGSPVAELLPGEVFDALTTALPGARVEVNLVRDPPWTPELLSEAAKQSLGVGP
jgi:hypothetical protein